MKYEKIKTFHEDEKELIMLVQARCHCSLCMAEKNRIKSKMGEKQFYKICEEIKHSHIH